MMDENERKFAMIAAVMALVIVWFMFENAAMSLRMSWAEADIETLRRREIKDA